MGQWHISIEGTQRYRLMKPYTQTRPRRVVAIYPCDHNLVRHVLVACRRSEGVLCIDNEMLVGTTRSKRQTSYGRLDSPVNHAKIVQHVEHAGFDLTFVPCDPDADYPVTNRHTKLIDWAIASKLPYVFVHDNDHGYFSQFPPRFEKHMFTAWLDAGMVRTRSLDLTYSDSAWNVIRAGMYTHGWTVLDEDFHLDTRTCTITMRGYRSIPLHMDPSVEDYGSTRIRIRDGVVSLA
jgi:hypothetical protein